MNIRERGYDDWKAAGPHEDMPNAQPVQGPRPASQAEAMRLDREATERRAAVLARLMARGDK